MGYAYDFENHLVQAGAGITIVYDGDGNRVSKTVAGVTTYLHYLGKAKLDGVTRDYWNTVFEKLVTLYGVPHVRNVVAYCFYDAMYTRGAKTTKTDKSDWFAEKFDEVVDHMNADEEFNRKRSQKAAAAKVPADAPEYRRNPTGREFLKPSDL